MGEMTLREHLAKAGAVKTAKKALSSRENGKKGGRPRGKSIKNNDLKNNANLKKKRKINLQT